MTTKIFTIALFLVFQVSLAQITWYASPTGTPSGDGSITNPWDLQTAFNRTTQILPGHTLCLRGGVYKGQFDCLLQGSSTNPVTVQSYPGEIAVLNGNTVFNNKNSTFDKIQTNGSSSIINSNPSIYDRVKRFYWSLDPEQKGDFYSKARNNPSLNQNGLQLINLPKPAVLNVYGGYVHFKKFEITCLGFFERDLSKPNFFSLDGIYNHETQNVGCKFIELVIYNLPGTGVDEWKDASQSEFNSCLVYNNGFYTSTTVGGISSNRGHGPAFYIQNLSNSTKLFKNNIAFSNLGTGFEIWSAGVSVSSVTDFVKNIRVEGNTIFDHQKFYDYTNYKPNVLMAACAFNAKNIEILDNALYHSMYFKAADQYQGVAISLGGLCEAPIGNNHPPLKNIRIENNFIAGRNSTLRIWRTLASNSEPIIFKNNIVYGRVNELSSLDLAQNNLDNPNWISNNNSFYTISQNGDRLFSLTSGGQLNFSAWQASPYLKDLNGTRTAIPIPGNSNPNPALPPIDYIKVKKFDYSNNKYSVTIAKNNIGTNNYTANISNSIIGIPNGTPYRIIDVENYHVESNLPYSNVYMAGTPITFNMQSTAFEAPLNLSNTPFGANLSTNNLKTPENFGCFIIEFDLCFTQPSPIITGNTFACDDTNDNTTHSTTLTPNQTASWSVTSGVGNILGSNNGSQVQVNWTALPGTVMLKVIDGNGCQKSTAITVQKGCACDIMNANYFTANLTGNTVSNFQFFNSITNNFGGPVYCDFGDGTPPTSNPTTHVYTTNGTYTIDMLFYAKQCSSHYYKTVVINSNKTNKKSTIVLNEINGTEDFVKHNLKIFPNPASSEITISGDLISDQKITIYNLLGQKVNEAQLNSDVNRIDVSRLAKGVYTIYFEKFSATYKFVKE